MKRVAVDKAVCCVKCYIFGKTNTKYHYIRTAKELQIIAPLFGESGYRYLHICCHATLSGMNTTHDKLTYAELGKILSPHLHGRRVFVAACKMGTHGFAKEILPRTGCLSLIGPSGKIRFADAAAFWISFYHLMFKLDHRRMSQSNLREKVRVLSALYQAPTCYFSSATRDKRDYRLLE